MYTCRICHCHIYILSIDIHSSVQRNHPHIQCNSFDHIFVEKPQTKITFTAIIVIVELHQFIKSNLTQTGNVRTHQPLATPTHNTFIIICKIIIIEIDARLRIFFVLFPYFSFVSINFRVNQTNQKMGPLSGCSPSVLFT